MMCQPIIPGFNSAAFHQAVLEKWKEVRGIRIPREGWYGSALFVTARPSLGFCIEKRGIPYPPRQRRMHFPFDGADRQQRREQFARALICLNGGYILDDYPGKVALWDQLPDLIYPSFGSTLRQVISGGKPFGEDQRELEASDLWKRRMKNWQNAKRLQGGAA